MASLFSLRFLNAIFCFSVFVFLLLVVRTYVVLPRNISAIPCTPSEKYFVKVNDSILEKFSGALQLQTISWDPKTKSLDKILQFIEYLRRSYPLVHSSQLIQREIVAKYNVLYTIKGTDTTLKPYMLMAHFDVVPIAPAVWEEEPFSGKVDKKNGYIWGRGAIDDKHAIMGHMEALELLLSKGFRPKRSFYLAYGHDEEVLGDGAGSIAVLLAQRGVTDLEFILDEGTVVTQGVVAGINTPVALVGVTEKGFLSLNLSVTSLGGHSSMALGQTSIGILSTALSRLENNPHPMQLKAPVTSFLEHMSAEMSFLTRIILSNVWLFSPIIGRIMESKAPTNALVRTTTAATMIHGGIKENVLPTTTWAVVNHRVHPCQTLQEVMDYDNYIINDPRVKMEVMSGKEPHPMSSYEDDHFGWQTLKTSVRQIWSEVVVTPGVMIGNTDTFNYLNLSKSIYRFSPTFMYPEDLPRFHGKNERIGIKNFEQAINFFIHVILNADKAALDPGHTHEGL